MSFCIFEEARHALGMTDAEWSAFLRERGGVSSSDDLYADAPEIVLAGRHVLNALIARGYRAPRAMFVSLDYVSMLLRVQRERRMTGEELHALAVGFGHPAKWPVAVCNGQVLQALVGLFRSLGCEMPELRRAWMTDARLRLVDRLRAAVGIGNAAFAALLRDFGGGVFRVDDLDEAGFDRLVVRLEELGQRGRA